MSPNVRAKPKTWEQLGMSITPILGNQPETIPWTWFDTATYVSGTTTQLDFFQTVQADKTLGNMQAAGQIPAPMYFELHHIGIKPVLFPSVTNTAAAAAVNTGATNDMERLINGSVLLQIAQKDYFSSKQFMCPPGAGSESQATMTGTFTAPQVDRFEKTGHGRPDLRSRNYFWGDLVIPHNQNFLVRLNWTAALTLAAGDTLIVIVLDGYLYRRVL